MVSEEGRVSVITYTFPAQMETAARERRERLAVLRGREVEPRQEEQKEDGRMVTVTVEERAAQILEAAKDVATIAPVTSADGKPALAELMPRGETEDLKQHIGARLEELEERTQEAILELVRERLSQSKG